ncbi:MAG: LysR family transcriptional regulator [Variovorax sp.]|jgi:LysR family glycine cleavage system transcriptional activator|nr:MAG: LysR family transcriptional regulator [Variovorax sp.]
MRQLPSFSALRAFEAAARQGGFTQAGEELSQTPSAISHQVRALEQWFGRPLFTRHVRRVALTDDGRRLLQELSIAFDQIEDACAALRPAAQRTELAVHCAPSFAAKWLGPRLAQFMQAHPAITIGLTSSAEPAQLERGDVDVDIAYGEPGARAGIAVEALGAESTLPMCAPALLASGPPVERPADLGRFTLIESRLNPVRWSDWWRLNGLKLPGRARPSFDRGSMALAAAVDGLGIALESTRFAEAELAQGRLVVIDGPAFRRIERQTHFLCYRKADRASPRLLAFRQWLLAELAAG